VDAGGALFIETVRRPVERGRVARCACCCVSSARPAWDVGSPRHERARRPGVLAALSSRRPCPAPGRPRSRLAPRAPRPPRRASPPGRSRLVARAASGRRPRARRRVLAAAGRRAPRRSPLAGTAAGAPRDAHPVPGRSGPTSTRKARRASAGPAAARFAVGAERVSEAGSVTLALAGRDAPVEAMTPARGVGQGGYRLARPRVVPHGGRLAAPGRRLRR